MSSSRFRGVFPAIGLTLLLTVLPVPLWAAEESDDESESTSVYLQYVGGVSVVRNQNVDGAGATGVGLSGSADLATGYAIGGAIGVKFLEHFRGELEITYNDADVDNFSLRGEPSTAKGGLSMLAIMANGYVDWDFGIGVTPYLGAGIGWGQAEFSARNRSGPQQSEIDDTDSVFVWSVMAGASVPVGKSLEFSLGYRYLASEDLRLSGRIGDDPQQPQRFDSEFDVHQVLAGMRLNF